MKMIEVDPVALLMEIGWASSRSDARRMIASGGVYIDNEKILDSAPFYFAGCSFLMKHGRKWIHIIFESMRKFYTEESREIWG